jgi:hypothetical protein
MHFLMDHPVLVSYSSQSTKTSEAPPPMAMKYVYFIKNPIWKDN